MLEQRCHLAITIQFRTDAFLKALRLISQVCAMALLKILQLPFIQGQFAPITGNHSHSIGKDSQGNMNALQMERPWHLTNSNPNVCSDGKRDTPTLPLLTLLSADNEQNCDCNVWTQYHVLAHWPGVLVIPRIGTETCTVHLVSWGHHWLQRMSVFWHRKKKKKKEKPGFVAVSEVLH